MMAEMQKIMTDFGQTLGVRPKSRAIAPIWSDCVIGPGLGLTPWQSNVPFCPIQNDQGIASAIHAEVGVKRFTQLGCQGASPKLALPLLSDGLPSVHPFINRHVSFRKADSPKLMQVIK